MAVTEEEARARQAETEERMRAAGVSPEQPEVQEDYFGFEETHRHYLPDRISYIEHQTLNHGARVQYLNKVNRDLKVNRATGDSSISLKPGDDKNALIETAVTGWNLKRQGQPVTFSKHNFNQWLAGANPKIVDELEKDIRKHNPWLLAELSVEDIDKEIASLQEMREVRLKEEEGKNS